MDSFVCLEKGIKENTNQLGENMDWLASHSNATTEMTRDIQRFSEMVITQDATITTLKDHVRELELGHWILWDCNSY